MANLFLTGEGVPNNTVGQVTDYYRDKVTNNIYYHSPTGWEAVPSLIPTPDGVGTTWYHGTTEPSNALGAVDDYYRDDTTAIIYRKHATNGWESKGSLDFIGVYGVQWGNGIGAPPNLPVFNNLPAGSFYLDVSTSDIYFKDNTLTWSLKGQLGGGSGGGVSVTVVDSLTSTSTTSALSANQGRVLKEDVDLIISDLSNLASLDSPNFTGTPEAPTPPNGDNSTRMATTAFVFQTVLDGQSDTLAIANGYTDDAVGTAIQTANSYADTLVIGLLDDRGNYDPTATSAYPLGGGSGSSGEVLKGDLWTISVDGTVGGVAVTVGDTIRALDNLPAQDGSKWAITQNNIIYVPENQANKVNNLTSPSNTTYPTSQAVANALGGKEPTLPTGSASQYIKGDKSLGTLNADAVPETASRVYLSPSQKTAATQNANASLTGLLSSNDWNNFNNKIGYDRQSLKTGSYIFQDFCGAFQYSPYVVTSSNLQTTAKFDSDELGMESSIGVYRARKVSPSDFNPGLFIRAAVDSDIKKAFKTAGNTLDTSVTFSTNTWPSGDLTGGIAFGFGIAGGSNPSYIPDSGDFVWASLTTGFLYVYAGNALTYASASIIVPFSVIANKRNTLRLVVSNGVATAYLNNDNGANLYSCSVNTNIPAFVPENCFKWIPFTFAGNHILNIDLIDLAVTKSVARQL